MSVVSTSRPQRRDKSASNTQKTHASAEDVRLAQIISNSNNEEDSELSKNVAQIMEVTGTTEDNARTALYDANNDTNKAIVLILESGSTEQSNEWETAGRKKNKNTQSSVRAVDTFDDEIKENAASLSGNWDHSISKGRGRGKSTKNRSKSNEPDRPSDDDNRNTFGSRERSQGGRRGRGRGRGGRSRGVPPRRFARYNQNRCEGNDGGSFKNSSSDFSERYGNFASPSITTDSQTWDEEADLGNLEVGTWSNEDSQKQTEKKHDDLNDGWGSWNDDIMDTQVFKSQNTQLSASGSLPLPQGHVTTQSSAPQMGERIDLGALFKKNQPDCGSSYTQQMPSDGLMGQSGMAFSTIGSNQHTTSSVIQQLQKQGQSNSLFSDVKSDNDSPSSRLFGAYERQGSGSTANNSLNIDHYNGRSTEKSYPQYNGKLVSTSTEGSSTLLGSFAEHFKTSEQNTMLGQISDLTNSAFTPVQQTESQGIPTAASSYHRFSQAQQREATQAVKASLGMPAGSSEPMDAPVTLSGPPGLYPNEPLSFGAPQPVRMQKQPRKKTPTGSSKIPASAVEMPGAGSAGYHEIQNFDLQFGMDDTTPATTTSIAVAGLPSSQNNLFSSGVPSSLINHRSPGNIDESSIFSSQLSNQTQQARVTVESSLQITDATASASLHQQQRYSEPLKPPEPLRGPPGISHPQALASSSAAESSLGVLTGSSQKPSDLSTTGGPYSKGRLSAGGNIPLSGLPHEAAKESSPNVANQSHSFYTSPSLTQQTQQHMISDLPSSAGRNLSPVPTASLSGSMQASPMAHMTGAPTNDMNVSTSPAISSLSSGFAQSHITPHVGGTPTKLNTTTASAPINILGSSSSGTSLGGSGGYGSMNMGYSASSVPSQSSSTPIAASPGKHNLMSNNNLYTSAGLSPLHHNQQPSSAVTTTSNPLGSALGSSVLSLTNANATKSSISNSVSKAGPPNLTLGVPPLLANQYGIPMGPGLMTAYTPEALYGYTDPLVAVQSRVHQMPNYYDMYNVSNPSANASSLNRESSSASNSQGKFGRGEPSSPTSLIGIVNSANTGLAQQQIATGQHNAQLKVSQTGSHQAQPFMNLPTAAAYPGFGNLYYNAFQYPPMFAAATAVPSAKHQVNTTAAFQQPATGFANAHSSPSIGVTSASSLHDLQGQGYSKNHMPAYEKQQAAFHHHTNTPPPTFNLQTLTAAMAAANTGAAAGAGPGMNPYTQAPFMTMLPTHQHSQIHLHVPQHGDVGQTVGSQRSQASNQMGKTSTKAPFGNAQYWGN